MPASGAQGAAFDGTNIWIANLGSSNLTRINPATAVGTAVALPAGAQGPRGLAFDGTYLWVVNVVSQNVTRMSPVTGVGTNFALPGGASSPSGVAPQRRLAWPSTAPIYLDHQLRYRECVQDFAVSVEPDPAWAMLSVV